MTAITQAMRNLAADILEEIGSDLSHNKLFETAELIREGKYDKHSVVSIISRFKAAKTAPQSLTDHGVTLSKSGSDVTVQCDTPEEAEEFLDWLASF